MYFYPYFVYRMQEQPHIAAQISGSSIQPQPVVLPPTIPFPPFTVGGCTQKWANMRLRDGRIINIFVTSITQKSIGGFLPNGRQMALDLNEIMEMTC